jgi:hypothetical protein
MLNKKKKEINECCYLLILWFTKIEKDQMKEILLNNIYFAHSTLRIK